MLFSEKNGGGQPEDWTWILFNPFDPSVTSNGDIEGLVDSGIENW